MSVRRGAVLTAMLLAVAGRAVPVGSQAIVPRPLDAIMEDKLDRTQRILRAIVLENFDVLERNALELKALAEEPSWPQYPSPAYERHHSDFLETSLRLIDAARARNLDAAALEYVDLTLKCVQCHKHVRTIVLPAEP